MVNHCCLLTYTYIFSLGKTDRIDLESFYPFLACLAEASRIHSKKPIHIAQTYTILNSPTRPIKFPDGSVANLVLLGEPISATADPEVWWPTAPSAEARTKLSLRLRREGYILPILVSLCVSLLRDMYTTTAIRTDDPFPGRTKRRVRLQYHKSPIADFGIVKGMAHVRNHDKLAYYRPSNNLFDKGQSPDEHYWIYFTALNGEEVVLDFGMFSLNACQYIKGEVYCNTIPLQNPLASAPAYFGHHDLAHLGHPNPAAHQRFSFLRNEALHKAVAFDGPRIDWPVIESLMRSISETEYSDINESLIKFWTLDNCGSLAALLLKRGWRAWPTEPAVYVEFDDERNLEDEEEWQKYMDIWNLEHNQGDTSPRLLEDSFRAFEAGRLPDAIDCD